MEGHQYVALRNLNIQLPDGKPGKVDIGELIPREVSDTWAPQAIRALVNVGRMQLASVLDQKTLPFISKRKEEHEEAKAVMKKGKKAK
jgi:hypothetical protein